MGLAILAPLPPHAASASGMTEAQTLIDKLWAAHEIVRREDGDSLLWVDRHYVHEGSFHAFSRLAERSVPVAEPGLTFGAGDHSTAPEHELAADEALEAHASQEREELLLECAIQRFHGRHSCLNTPITLPRISTCSA